MKLRHKRYSASFKWAFSVASPTLQKFYSPNLITNIQGKTGTMSTATGNTTSNINCENETVSIKKRERKKRRKETTESNRQLQKHISISQESAAEKTKQMGGFLRMFVFVPHNKNKTRQLKTMFREKPLRTFNILSIRNILKQVRSKSIHQHEKNKRANSVEKLVK